MKRALWMLMLLGAAVPAGGEEAPPLPQKAPAHAKPRGEAEADAAAAVPEAPSARDIQAVVDRLGADTFADREAAQAELERIGYPAFSALQAALTSDNLEIRGRAARLLERLAFRTLFERWLAKQPNVPQLHRWYAVTKNGAPEATYHWWLTRQEREDRRYAFDAETIYRDGRRFMTRAVLSRDCIVAVVRETTWRRDEEGYTYTRAREAVAQTRLKETKLNMEGNMYKVTAQDEAGDDDERRIVAPGTAIAEPLVPLIAVEMLDESWKVDLSLKVLTGDIDDPKMGRFYLVSSYEADLGRGTEPVRRVAFRGPLFDPKQKAATFVVATDASRFQIRSEGDAEGVLYAPITESEAKAAIEKLPAPDWLLPGGLRK